MNGRVSRLFVHPVKSFAAVEVSSAFVLSEGFRSDRRWMVVDADGTFVTQREVPSMANVRAAFGDEAHTLTLALGDEALTFDTAAPGQERSVRIWDDTVRAREAPAEVNAFVSKHLGLDAALVALVGERPVDPRYGAPGDKVSLADGYPYLVASEASVAALEERARQDLDVRRFRPNIVVADVPAFAEDTHAFMTIASIRFRLVKPCARCAIVDVDPLDGTRSVGTLKSLASFRKREHNVFFAMNAIADATGLIEVGADVVFSEPRKGPCSGDAR